MNVLLAASECAPFAKTGGLADVMHALPQALRRRKHSVSLVVPFYRALREQSLQLQDSSVRLNVPLGNRTLHPAVWMGQMGEEVTLFAIQQDELFDRSGIYAHHQGEYYDNAQRFIFFSQAVIELAKYIEPQVQIIHANDWHTALIPAYVRAIGLPFRTIFTIHNLAYQGHFPAEEFSSTGLPIDYFSPLGFEFYGRFNFLKGGISFADQVTTVSPTYAREIQMEQYGCGLDQVLVTHRQKLTGILNGIDTHVWNPASDPYLTHHYDSGRLEKKWRCKLDLFKQLGFHGDERKPLFGFVARLVKQKGVPLLLEIMENIIQRGIRLVTLGQGEGEYERAFKNCAQRWPNQVKMIIGYDESFAHRIEAGSDFFLMPSEFEPCGLNQLYSLRYGTIPIVHQTGGLADSVTPWNGKQGTGFLFSEYSAAALLEKIDAALEVYNQPEAWTRIRQNAMRQNFSWDASVLEYEKVYRAALVRR